MIEVKEIDINELKPYKKNPRKNDESVDFVMNSIKEFGFKVPIVVDKNNVIVAGHTRYKASKKLGLKKVPCIVADDLSEEQINAYRLADNKVGENSSWDKVFLDIELDNIVNINMEDFGFFNDEKKEEDEKGEVEFSEVIGEEHNYIVLYFDNDVDWLQAESLFELKPVMCGSTRKDEEIKSNMRRIGVGRVLKGSDAINKILGVKNENIG